MTTERRQAITAKVAEHLLREGLAGASLRPMAQAAGTSDRMLLYYFVDREALLSAALTVVAEQLAETLEGLLTSRRSSFARLLRSLWAAFRQPELAPYLQLWLEVAASAARGQEPFRTIGGTIADAFVAWAEDHLVPDEAGQGALLLATVDGLALLDAVGRGDAADAAVRAFPG